MPKKITTQASACKLPPGFPLFVHPRGYWAKKVRGKTEYFGKVADDPDGQKALAEWLEQKDNLLAGRKRRPKAEGFTVVDLCNRFLGAKRRKRDSGELSASSFGNYFATCKRIIDHFGADRLVADLDAEDFEGFRASMAKGWSPVTLGNEINRVRVVFNFATANRLVSHIEYGSEFRKPSKKVLRAERAKKGPRMFEAVELRAILDKAGVTLKAMILLGVNAGYGNTDIIRLPISALNLKTGWADYPRPKTGIPRRCPLWPETIAAVREALDKRPTPKSPEHAELLFVTKYGAPWGEISMGEPNEQGKAKIIRDDAVGKQFSKVLLGLGLKRPGLAFYALRHTLETIGGNSRDQVAVDALMGHVRDDMASVYREGIDDDRLRAVVDHVRAWLFPGVAKDEGTK